MYRRFSTMIAVFAVVAGALQAQGGGRGVGNGFQQFGTVAGPDGQPVTLQVMRPAGMTPITGAPVSATETRRTVQTLGDGTLLERTETNLLFRDSQGRTRTEQTRDGKTTVMIVDPVAHFTAQLDPAARTVRRTTTGGWAIGLAPTESSTAPRATTEVRAATEEALARLIADRQKIELERSASTEASAHTTTEDLGTLHQNGVPAQGTRTTLVIPAGKIGNNRDIKVVNERWYSSELQMLVKSVNSDPRFGTTTYELTNVLRATPDAGLFQIPGDYTVMEGGARGRGGAGPVKK